MNYADYIRTKLSRFTWIRQILLPFSHYLRNRTLKKMNKHFLEEANDVFSKIYECLENKICFWPEFGTLLGIYRDGGFMKHDFDFDFGAFSEDADDIIEILINNGFVKSHEYIGIEDKNIRECTFEYKGISIDFFFFVKQDTFNCFTFHPLEIHKNKSESIYKIKIFQFPPFTLEQKPFLNRTILVPSPIDTHLEYSYGKGFMIPDPNFKSIHNTFLDSFAKEV